MINKNSVLLDCTYSNKSEAADNICARNNEQSEPLSYTKPCYICSKCKEGCCTLYDGYSNSVNCCSEFYNACDSNGYCKMSIPLACLISFTSIFLFFALCPSLCTLWIACKRCCLNSD